MSPDEVSILLKQHSDLIVQVDLLWRAVIVLAFLGLAFILSMLILAVWSVKTVTKRFDNVAGKWQELISLLVHNAREHN